MVGPAGLGLFIFDIGWGELVIIGVVALIAIGPKELPSVLRTLGQYMGKIKRLSAEFQGQFQEALREAELADLKKHAQDIQSTVTDFSSFDPLANAEREMTHGLAGPETAAEPAIAHSGTEPAAADTVVTQPVPTETAAAEPSLPLPAIDVPLPEPVPPPRAEDFSEPPQPAQKQA
jgi:sec-independent protein translocase protein TatB